MGHLGDTEAYMRSLCKATWRLGVLAGWGWVTQCALSFCPVRMRWEGGYLQPKKRAFAEELNWLAPWILDFPASQNSEKCLLWWWFSCSVMSNSLQPHELQHARIPCPSPFPGACSNSCPLSRWCHLTISSSVVPFSSCLQSFPASGSFPMSQLFASGGQKNWSFCVSISPSSEYSELISFRINLFHLLAFQGTLKSLLEHHSSKASILQCSAFFIVQLSHPYMTTGKTIALTRRTFVSKVMSLLFNKLSKLVLNKEQASFNFMAAVTICSDFGAQENNVCHCFHFPPIYLPWSDGTRCHDLSFLNVEFQASFFTLPPSSRGSLVPLCFLP